MAILKMIDPPIHPDKGGNKYRHLRNAIKYAQREDKSHGYIGNLNCTTNRAFQEMIETKKYYGKEPKREDDRVGYHFMISWSPEEKISPEMALEITQEFCKQYLGDYEVAFGVHLDKTHIHSHVVFNSVNFVNGKKFRYELNDWERMQQPLLDRLCEEKGLHKLEDDTGIPLGDYKKYRGANRGKKKSAGRVHSNHNYENEKEEEYSFSDYLRQKLDDLVYECDSFDDFVKKLSDQKYSIKYGKSEVYGEYMAIKGPGMKKYRRTQTLGRDYTMDMLKQRIDAYHNPVPDENIPDVQYLFPGKVYRCRFVKIENVYLRKQYARLYRLGVIPPKTRKPSYRETRERIKQIRLLEYQINLVTEREYKSEKDIDPDISRQEQKIKGIREEIRACRKQYVPYGEMLDTYDEMDELEAAYGLYQEGDEHFRNEAERYLALKGKVEKLPHTKGELESYEAILKKRIKELKQKLSEETKILSSIKELRAEYETVMKDYEPADDNMIDSLQNQGVLNKRQRSRKEL
ncbi:MAG: relaxase/mobilization nuclease domain-containing protein [Roseburia sp.]